MKFLLLPFCNRNAMVFPPLPAQQGKSQFAQDRGFLVFCQWFLLGDPFSFLFVSAAMSNLDWWLQNPPLHLLFQSFWPSPHLGSLCGIQTWQFGSVLQCHLIFCLFPLVFSRSDSKRSSQFSLSTQPSFASLGGGCEDSTQIWGKQSSVEKGAQQVAASTSLFQLPKTHSGIAQVWCNLIFSF